MGPGLLHPGHLRLLGIWNLASAARPPHTPLWTSQAIYLAVGLVAALVVCLVDYRLDPADGGAHLRAEHRWRSWRCSFIGHKAKGAESWFVLGPLRLQPAEFMKIGVVLMLAKVYHDDFRPNQEAYGLLRLWKPLLVVAVPAVLVLVQPDLGTAMMILLSRCTVILFGKVRWYLVAVMVAGLLAVGRRHLERLRARAAASRTRLILRSHLKKHQSQRISGWLDPEADLKGSGYHAAQSKIAVG